MERNETLFPNRLYHNKKQKESLSALFLNLNPGNDLLSHTASSAVSSAQVGLTSVFGMGTGVTPTL